VKALLLVLVVSCSKPQRAEPNPYVHVLTLPSEQAPNLPDAPGRSEVLASCMTCHGARYIATQPRLPRQTWEAEVDKMRNVYGAPVSPEDAPKIVGYLVTLSDSKGL